MDTEDKIILIGGGIGALALLSLFAFRSSGSGGGGGGGGGASLVLSQGSFFLPPSGIPTADAILTNNTNATASVTLNVTAIDESGVSYQGSNGPFSWPAGYSAHLQVSTFNGWGGILPPTGHTYTISMVCVNSNGTALTNTLTFSATI